MSETDLEAIKRQQAYLLETFQTQNAKYGDSWKNDGLDARALFAEINAKYRRLRELVWYSWPRMSELDHRAKTVETLFDLALYCHLMVRRLEYEFGTDGLDEKVRSERDKT